MKEAGTQKMKEHSADSHVHDHVRGLPDWFNREWLTASTSLFFLVAGLMMDAWYPQGWFTGPIRLLWYLVAYVPVGLPVLWMGIKLAFKGKAFTEFTLMSIATLGAFYIGEYPEGVAVMLFYSIGELFQDSAVRNAKRSISALLDVRPDRASVLRQGVYVSENPCNVEVGETIRVKAGERVPLDGEMISDGSSFNTAALTGESLPSFISAGKTVLAGMINETNVADIRVTKTFNNSALSRILELVQTAQGRKAKTELFIRKFASAYTPIVVLLAAGLVAIPYLFVHPYDFNEWLYRALIFLVISCPCALVVAIPLGYFGGIGAGSRNGILFKGSTFLDRIRSIDTIVMDKTGTLTKGIFRVQKVVSSSGEAEDWYPLVAALEAQSNHPIARAIAAHSPYREQVNVTTEEVRGLGLKGTVDGKVVAAGNEAFFRRLGLSFDKEYSSADEAVIGAAIDGVVKGYIFVADEIRDDSAATLTQLHRMKIKTAILSGDKNAVVQRVAQQLGIKQAFGELLPEEKVERFREIRNESRGTVAFVGDGINDAPVLAISDIGIAMGGLGSDVAIETADVVIQTDQPSRILTAIRIARATNHIVWQNISLAFGVKLIVLVLGAWGVASMWEAVFADVGVALLAILNAVRIQRMNFE